MAYSNPILGAVQSSQAAKLQNKQFEASFGLQLAQFAENKANTKKDQDYRQDVLGENKRATGVAETANAALVDLEAERFKGAKPQRDANLALTNSQAGAQDALAAQTTQQTSDAVVVANKTELGKTFGFMQSRLMDDNGLDIPLEGNPQAQADFTTFMNMPGVNKTIQGKNGEPYEFVGIVPAGEDRSVVQIRDPNNPDKVMYMSRDRTAVEGDPLTAVNLMGIKAFREKISIAVRQAADKDLPTDLRLASEAFNLINGRPKDQPQTLSPDTLQESQNLAEAMTADQQQPKEQPKAQKLGTSRTDVGPYENGVPTETAVMDPSNHDLSTYSWDQLNSLTDSQWDTALESSEERLQTMLDRPVVFGNVDKMIERNNKTIASVQKRIDEVDGEVPDGLQGQMQLLNNNSKRLDARKAAGNDTVDAAQKAHNDLLSAKEVADGKKPAPTATVKAAAKIVADSKLSPRQLKNPDLDAAVDAEILKNPPPRAEIAQAIIKPMKMTPGLLYKLRAAQSMGMIDEDAIARVVDVGVLSVTGAEIIKQQLIEAGELAQTQMNNQNDLLKEAMKIAGDAGKPTIKTNGAGQVVSLDANGQEQWRTSIGDPRSTADQTAIIAQHSGEGKNGLDIEESIDLLGRQLTLSTKDTPMPELEQNLLAQNLQSYLVDELSIGGLPQWYDWVRGSDEDDVHNPMEMVTTNFAYDPKTQEIWLFDKKGERHANQDYTLSRLSPAVQLVLPGILKTPEEVQLKIKVEKLRRVKAEIAKLTK